jgi:hypothetical protein
VQAFGHRRTRAFVPFRQLVARARLLFARRTRTESAPLAVSPRRNPKNVWPCFTLIVVVWSPPRNRFAESSTDSFGQARSSFVAIVVRSGPI